MLFVPHKIDDVVPEHEPEPRYDFAAEPGAMEEVSYIAVSVRVAPDGWGEPGQKAGEDQ